MPRGSIRPVMRFFMLLTLISLQFAVMPLLQAKPQAPVLIEYQLPKAQLQPNSQINLQLSLTNTVDVDDLQVNVRLSQGLQASNFQSQYNFGVMPQNQLSSINIDLSASTAGQYRVYITAAVRFSGQQQTRVIVIPLLIGDVLPEAMHKSSAPMKVDSSGRAIVAMPAQKVNP